MRIRSSVTAVAVALTVALAGCASDSGGDSRATDSSTAAKAAAPTDPADARRARPVLHQRARGLGR